jgi:hypothetical protein
MDLSPEHEAVVVAFRRHTLLPLDDCLSPSSRPSPTSHAHTCTAASGANASAGCQGGVGIGRQDARPTARSTDCDARPCYGVSVAPTAYCPADTRRSTTPSELRHRRQRVHGCLEPALMNAV